MNELLVITRKIFVTANPIISEETYTKWLLQLQYPVVVLTVNP